LVGRGPLRGRARHGLTPQRPAALKGQHIPAQGNALGERRTPPIPRPLKGRGHRALCEVQYVTPLYVPPALGTGTSARIIGVGVGIGIGIALQPVRQVRSRLLALGTGTPARALRNRPVAGTQGRNPVGVGRGGWNDQPRVAARTPQPWASFHCPVGASETGRTMGRALGTGTSARIIGVGVGVGVGIALQPVRQARSRLLALGTGTSACSRRSRPQPRWGWGRWVGRPTQGSGANAATLGSIPLPRWGIGDRAYDGP
jgi:hypothetical protein